MFRRGMLLTLFSALILSVAGCGDSGQPAQPAAEKAAEPAPPPPKPEEQGPVWELTKDDITSHSDWTSRNISILGAKIGDKANSVVKNFGEQENTRTLAEDYLTIYQKNGLFVYTFKITGKIRRFEVYEPFAGKIKDENFKKLLSGGNLKFMRDTFGMEEKMEENAEDMSTEYAYDAKGFRFVKYKVGNKTLNAIRFMEIKKSTT